MVILSRFFFSEVREESRARVSGARGGGRASAGGREMAAARQSPGREKASRSEIVRKAGLPLHITFGVSACAACLSESLTIPLDTAKVRLQLQSLALGDRSALKYRGPLHTIKTMVVEEGVLSLFNGLTPGLHRQFLFTGIRLGLYDKLKELVGGEASGIAERTGLAVLTSAIGITVSVPPSLALLALERVVEGRSNSY